MAPADNDLDTLHGSLRKLSTDLDDLNSAYPETKRFLEARGLTNVRQLDKKGREELKEHLLAVLKTLSV